MCFKWLWQNANAPSTYYQVRTANLSIVRSLYTADSVGGNPAVSNVRSGTVYGPNNELTGTCAVPGASSVVVGVPVDNTVGTAAVTAASIRSALGLASANLDTQLAAIPTTAAPTAAAIRSEMDSNSTKLANLDATVSSRLAASGYTAPPSAADIAAAVWAAATRTLTTAIDNSATIAAAVWSYATGRTITGGTVDTLTNAPSVPSAAAIASQVRTELGTELARIDTTISSRLAPGGTLARVTLTDTATTLTNAPTVPSAAEISAAVWAAADKAGYSLTEAERTAIATAVQAGILNESDGQAILQAIVNAIGNTNVDQIALVAAIRADLERSGGTLATRLAAADYSAPPSSATVASSVRTELATELSRLDVAVSTRPSAADVAAAVWSYGSRVLSSVSAIVSGVWGAASRTVTGGSVDSVTTLVNAPDVPSAAEIAAEVRSELTPELARVSNSATTQEVAEIVQDAVNP